MRPTTSSTVRSTLAAAGLGALALAVAPPVTPAAAEDFSAGAVRIEAPWLRATPAGAKVAGGYMKLTNTGSVPDRLIGGSSPVAGGFEVHEMKMEGSVMKMRELPNGLQIPPGKSVELKPGSYHIMLTSLGQPLKDGDRIKGTLAFEKAGTVEVEFSVRGMGAMGEAPGDGMAGPSHGNAAGAGHGSGH